LKGIWAISILVSILIIGISVAAIPTASATHPVTEITLPAGTPRDIDIDPSLNQIYVSLESTGVLAIIAGGTNAITTVAIGAPLASIDDGEMSVNTVTHNVYMADLSPSSFIVVDGVTKIISTIPGVTPGCVVSPAANSVTNVIYGSTQCSDSIVAMDGATGLKISSRSLGGVGSVNAVNPSTDTIYNAVTPQFRKPCCSTRVFDGSVLPSAPLLIATLPGFVLTINPVTNLVYSQSDPILAYDGSTSAHVQDVSVSISLGAVNNGMGVNPITNTLYVSLGALDQVAIIDLNTNLEIDRVDVPDNPGRIAVNPDTGKVYVLHTALKKVSVFDDFKAPPPTVLTVDFDAIDTSSGRVSGAIVDDYLATFGITAIDSGSGGPTRDFTIWTFDRSTGVFAIASSPPNGFFRNFGNEAYSYSLNFATPLDDFQFTRASYDTSFGGIISEAWNAEAFDSGGIQIGPTVSEGLQSRFGASPPVQFSFSGPDIAKVTFFRDTVNTFAGIAQVPLDDLILTVPAFIPPLAIDADGDGFDENVDCDDGDPAVNPGASEVDDGIDNNCDGTVDETFDQDGDGFTPLFGDDCDDANAAVNPGASEVDDGIDNNCDGAVDETFDQDSDGFTPLFGGDCE